MTHNLADYHNPVAWVQRATATPVMPRPATTVETLNPRLSSRNTTPSPDVITVTKGQRVIWANLFQRDADYARSAKGR